MSDEGGEIGAFMAGFVIGGLVGAATALIMAPQSGAETRAQITAKGDEWRHTGEQRLQDYRDYAGTAVSDTRGRMADTSGQIQERARIVLDEGKAKTSEAQDGNGEPQSSVQDETTPQDNINTSEEGDDAT